VPTISDVARRAGVSTVTVSRVINSARNVKPGTRERVEHAIQDLGYLPNVAARSLRSKRTRALALLVPDITNAFWTTVARGVEDAAQSRGYSVFLCNTDENPTKQTRYLQAVASQQVDGVIIAPYSSDASSLAELRERGLPTVIVDRRVDGWEVDTVLGDSPAGAYALVHHLIAKGHRRIAVVSGPAGTSTADERVAGYRLALAEAGIAEDVCLIRRGEFRASAGERLTRELFDEGIDPTAIFAGNNAMALGVLSELERRGLNVPEDVALVCIDDLPNADRCFPSLTVAVQPAYQMGATAAQLLLSRLEDDASAAQRLIMLPLRMILRGAFDATAANSRPQEILIEPFTAQELNRLSLIH
jgi:LacI family transcriptional regulator